MRDVVLEGEYVILRPMVEADVEGIYQAGNDERIWSYLPMKVESLEDAQILVMNALKEKEKGLEFPFVIVNKSDGKIVGSTRFLDISEAQRSLEIGWTFLNPSVWRSAVNTECKYLLLKYCFEELKCIRVQLKTDERNVRSQTAIKRIGGKYEGTLRKHRVLKDGFIRNSVYFSIVDDEWPEVKSQLERKRMCHES